MSTDTSEERDKKWHEGLDQRTDMTPELKQELKDRREMHKKAQTEGATFH